MTQNYIKELIDAAGSGNIKKITELLEQEAININASEQDGVTALMKAAHRGQVETIKFLIASGAIVNVQDNDGCTALMHAANALVVSTEVAKLLIDAGANINAVNNTGQTALCIVTPRLEKKPAECQQEELKFLQQELENAKKNAAALLLAANGNLEEVKRLILEVSAGANVYATNTCGVTALMLAATYGHLDTVTFLLERGADTNATDRIFGETALMCATQEGYEEIVKLLLQHGADPNITVTTIAGEKKIALDMLPENRSKNLLLLLEGASNKDEALQRAVQLNDVAAVKRLLKAGADAAKATDTSNEEITNLLKTAAMRRKGA